MQRRKQNQVIASHLCLAHLAVRYRRSYDSQFSAPVVRYHVWPALVQGDLVLIKGEAVTKRAAVVQTSTCCF